jgi:cysteine desulfurase
VGFGIALERLDPGRYEPLAALRDEVEGQLAQYAQVNGAGTERLPHVSNLSFHDWTGERLVAALDLGGLCVSTGSACSVGTAQPSEAVLAMMGAERAKQAVRISLGEDTDADEMTRALRVFQHVLKRPS